MRICGAQLWIKKKEKKINSTTYRFIHQQFIADFARLTSGRVLYGTKGADDTLRPDVDDIGRPLVGIKRFDLLVVRAGLVFLQHEPLERHVEFEN